MRSGVYTITNLVNGRVYVGKSVDLDRRIKAHKYGIRREKPDGCTMPAIIEDAKLHGKDAFVFEIVALIEDADEMGRVELATMLKFDSLTPGKGYNTSYRPADKRDRRAVSNPYVPPHKRRLPKLTGKYRFEAVHQLTGLTRSWSGMREILADNPSFKRQGIFQACDSKGVYKGFYWKKFLR